jgi:hypothetical protein
MRLKGQKKSGHLVHSEAAQSSSCKLAHVDLANGQIKNISQNPLT